MNREMQHAWPAPTVGEAATRHGGFTVPVLSKMVRVSACTSLAEPQLKNVRRRSGLYPLNEDALSSMSSAMGRPDALEIRI
jgi:hypothetical protein